MPINQSPNPLILDRIVGCLVGGACADALGAPFEFGPPLADEFELEMIGGGTFGWKPGQFTDDTEMAIPIAKHLFAGTKKGASTTLDKLVEDWCIWAKTAKDVGVQTRSVLSSLKTPTEAEARAKAAKYHLVHNERSGGNGGLMRAFPVPLAYPTDVDGLVDMTRRTVLLTHWEQDAYEAAILWNLAIRTSYIQNKLEVRDQLFYLPESSRPVWEQRIEVAERELPVFFTNTNGWVVSAFQAAWSALHHSDSYVEAVSMAVIAASAPPMPSALNVAVPFR